jgi:hypothetical protein
MKTMYKLYELEDKIADYCILDEDDLGSREYEQACKAYDNYAKYDLGKQVEEAGIAALLDYDGDFDPTEEQEATLRELVCDAIMEYDSLNGSYRDETLLKMIAEAFPKPHPVPGFELNLKLAM